MKIASPLISGTGLVLRIVAGVSFVAYPTLARENPSPVGARAADDSIQSIQVSWVGAEVPSIFTSSLASWFTSEPDVRVEQVSQLLVAPVDANVGRNRSQVWVDVRQLPRVRIYFAYSSATLGSRYLVHDVLLDEGLSELGTEQLAQVIYSSLLALQEGRAENSWSEVQRTLGPSATDHLAKATSSPTPALHAALPMKSDTGTLLQSELQAAKSVERPCPIPTWEWHVSAATGYGFNLRGDEHLAHGPTFWSMLALAHETRRIGVFVSARYLLPVVPIRNGVEVRLNGLQLRIGPTLEVALASRLWASVGVGIGIDEIQAQPRSLDSGKKALEGGWNERTLASSCVGLHMPTAIGTLSILGNLDVQLQRSGYDLATRDGRQQSLLSAPWLQPGVILLLRFDSTVR